VAYTSQTVNVQHFEMKTDYIFSGPTGITVHTVSRGIFNARCSRNNLRHYYYAYGTVHDDHIISETIVQAERGRTSSYWHKLYSNEATIVAREIEQVTSFYYGEALYFRLSAFPFASMTSDNLRTDLFLLVMPNETSRIAIGNENSVTYNALDSYFVAYNYLYKRKIGGPPWHF
jgi:hypothetical protein